MKWALAILLLLFCGFISLAYLFYKESQPKVSIEQNAAFQFSTTIVQKEDGKETSLSKVLGEPRGVFFSFWATWCEPCLEEIPNILSSNIPKKLNLQWVNVDYGSYLDRIKEVREWKKKNKINLVTIFDHQGNLSEKSKLEGIPLNIVTDANGKIIWSKMGLLKAADFIKIEEMAQSL